jgi:glycerol transport system permease protein
MSGTGRQLVALLAYAGLQSIPDAYYQAAKIDGAPLERVSATSSCPRSWAC